MKVPARYPYSLLPLPVPLIFVSRITYSLHPLPVPFIYVSRTAICRSPKLPLVLTLLYRNTESVFYFLNRQLSQSDKRIR